LFFCGTATKEYQQSCQPSPKIEFCNFVWNIKGKCDACEMAIHDEAAMPWIFFIQAEEYLKNILYF